MPQSSKYIYVNLSGWHRNISTNKRYLHNHNHWINWTRGFHPSQLLRLRNFVKILLPSISQYSYPFRFSLHNLCHRFSRATFKLYLFIQVIKIHQRILHVLKILVGSPSLHWLLGISNKLLPLCCSTIVSGFIEIAGSICRDDVNWLY